MHCQMKKTMMTMEMAMNEENNHDNCDNDGSGDRKMRKQ